MLLKGSETLMEAEDAEEKKGGGEEEEVHPRIFAEARDSSKYCPIHYSAENGDVDALSLLMGYITPSFWTDSDLTYWLVCNILNSRREHTNLKIFVMLSVVLNEMLTVAGDQPVLRLMRRLEQISWMLPDLVRRENVDTILLLHRFGFNFAASNRSVRVLSDICELGLYPVLLVFLMDGVDIGHFEDLGLTQWEKNCMYLPIFWPILCVVSPCYLCVSNVFQNPSQIAKDRGKTDCVALLESWEDYKKSLPEPEIEGDQRMKKFQRNMERAKPVVIYPSDKCKEFVQSHRNEY